MVGVREGGSTALLEISELRTFSLTLLFVASLNLCRGGGEEGITALLEISELRTHNLTLLFVESL